MVGRASDVTWQFNVELIEKWIEQNGAGARELLAGTIGKSISFLDKARRTKRLPNGASLFALAEALEVPVERLVLRVPKKRTA